MPADREDDATPVLKCERAPMLVRDVFEAKGYRELDEEEGEEGGQPTCQPTGLPQVWHVHWKGGRFKPSEYASANPLQRLNHFPKTMGITKKDCLLRNLRRMRATHGAIFAFFPESYILPSEYMTLVRVCDQRNYHRPNCAAAPPPRCLPPYAHSILLLGAETCHACHGCSASAREADLDPQTDRLEPGS